MSYSPSTREDLTTTMHTFDEYSPQSAAQLIALVRAHPFALVINASPAGPIATHVPVILPPGSEPDPHRLSTLWGHMARENPQWQEFRTGTPVLVVFQGADAYISAEIYQRTPAVPTWNYSAVHVSGIPTLIDDEDETLAVLTATVAASERTRPAQWDMSSSVDHFRRIIGGVVAFSIAVTGVQGVFKLSQDKPPVLWDRVQAALSDDPSAERRQVADDMAAVRRRL